jgi:hypothetical protein
MHHTHTLAVDVGVDNGDVSVAVDVDANVFFA